MDKRKLSAAECWQDQQGFVLLTALAFMIVLTVIVLSTVNVSSSDEKIARNSRDKDIAFAAAAAALRDAEIYISGGYQFPYSPNNNPALFPAMIQTPDQSDFFNTADPNYGNTCAIQAIGGVSGTVSGCKLNSTNTCFSGGAVTPCNITNSPTIAGVANQPRYLIDIVPLPTPLNSNMTCPCYAFRITAQGEGRSANTRATLQEYYWPP